MRRVTTEMRPNATRLVQSQGLVYTKPADSPDPTDNYWPDDRYYSFTSAETALLEEASRDVFAMCCEAADYLVDHPHVMHKMGIPDFAVEQVIKSWDREPAWGSLYGRFDICFGGLDHADPRLRVPKFYEFNADTPTSLVEAASIQWLWLEQTGHGNDQFNSITKDLVAAWKRNMALIEQRLGRQDITVHFAVAIGDDLGEDTMTVFLLLDACQLAGWRTKTLLVEDIGLGADGRFYDAEGEHIDVIFKLYPWEMMINEDFGKACFEDMAREGGTIWIEPPYKMLWSNKAIFAVLWDLFKDDPRSRWLLPTYFEDEAPASLTRFARKPIFAREGADIILEADGKVIQHEKSNQYGQEGFVIQELAILPEFKDHEDKEREDKDHEHKDGGSHYPVIGFWFVDGDPAGIGIREDIAPITTNCSAFVPHSISDGPVNYKRQPVPDLSEIEASMKLEEYQDLGPESKEILTYIHDILHL
ncbi:hypothetical protein CDD82_6154 [Ophiocordyceps australis]|uniref:Glutathionylspermidine synthase pre-ATP-grasp-like domain-containing protein n=1 Tax=Ophiocordyceps australis TaxID=1399860 RepID=A0A2C5Y3D0_9HYPO|nr:hypothetical protein CDD82_6154 [Ophiocordyceps australis]